VPLRRRGLTVATVVALVATFGSSGFSGVERASAAGGFVCGAYDQTAKRGRTPTPDAEGRVFPIVTIHGITGSDDDFDRTINKSYGEANPQPPRSVLDALAGPKAAGQTLPPGLPGVRVYSFSYTPDSLRWIDNPAVGGRFEQTIDCLYAKFHTPVSVIAHSMGGLVTRWVANTTDANGVSRATKLGKVITLGTPYAGSFMSAVANGATDVAGVSAPAVALLNYVCGASGTATGNGSCGPIPLYAAFRSEAGRNQRTGAQTINDLKRWPPNVDVETIAGSQTIPLVLFGSPLNAAVDIGDFAVATGSATADPRAGRVFSCRYDSATGTASTIMKQILGLATPQERHAKLTGAFLASPCYHSNLMQNVELTNEILGSLNDWLTVHRAVMTTVPLVGCPTQSARSDAADPLPSRAALKNSIAGLGSISLYADSYGYGKVPAPSGWTCRATAAFDGNASVAVLRPGGGPRDPEGLDTLAQGIYLWLVPACSGCTYDTVCPLFPDSELGEFASFFQYGCSRPGPEVKSRRASRHVMTFEAPALSVPPGYDRLTEEPAVGAIIYNGMEATPSSVRAGQIACVLPPENRPLCDAVVREFVARYEDGAS
jgi:pimeloyl-ACP methyl ester carboxylesterase